MQAALQAAVKLQGSPETPVMFALNLYTVAELFASEGTRTGHTGRCELPVKRPGGRNLEPAA